MRVKEDAGLRRFGYPVHALLPDDFPADTKYRLLRDGKPVPAQFRVVENAGRKVVALDFNVNIGPGEGQVHEVEYGGELAETPEPKGGMAVGPIADGLQVRNGKALHWDFPGDLKGLLRSAENARLEFVRDDSDGLWTIARGGERTAVAADPRTPWAVERQGPLAVGLRCAGTIKAKDGAAVPWRATLTVPSSKSWIELNWALDDPRDRVEAIGLSLNLNVAGPAPVLVDFGANNTVYGTLKPNESMELMSRGISSESGWEVRKIYGDRVEDFARAANGSVGAAEGWAHVMDAQRCSALALSAFGRDGKDSIAVDGRGEVRVAREFHAAGRSAKTPKALRFWMHVVGVPVQIGAVTSPQAMLAPLEVAWGEQV